MGIIGDTREAFRRASSGNYRHERAGHVVRCSICGSDQFDYDTRMLNTRGATFLGLDWANESAVVLVCRECGHLEWFIDR
ncbi:MAG: DNA-binding protein [Eggerthellaceae bacterium]|nr:DNA-binding protein [Eggerthellaceae bacterium]